MKPQIKRFFQNKTKFVIFLVAILCFGVTYWAVSKETATGQAASSTQSACDMNAADQPIDAKTQKGGTVYVCPMNCVPPAARAGRCPVCGMDLVATAAEKGQDHRENTHLVSLSPEKIRAAGIRVASAERKFVTKEVRLFGKIEYDPVAQYKVTAFAPGIIDRIYVKRAGQMVRAGDPLFDMHSSELFVLEQDLFEVLKQFPDAVDYRPARGQIYKRQMRPPRRQFNLPKPGEVSKEDYDAKKAALEKLTQIQRKMMLLGLSKEDIERIMARGLPSGISTVVTPTTGIVQQQFAFKGSYVNTGETVFTIANPKFVWARIEGYAADFRWIRLHQQAEFHVDAYPGETFKGKVLYLDPEFDPKTRTFKVGVLYTDTQKRLRPNMLVRCVIHARMTADGVSLPDKKSAEKPPLVIPESAPLITGKRAIVYVETPGKSGTFEAREVALGPQAKGHYVVLGGLYEGEKVVVNGNFKIDSAVQILAQPSMMEHDARQPMPEHRHHVATQAMKMEMKIKPQSTKRENVKPTSRRRDKIKERWMKLKPKSQ